LYQVQKSPNLINAECLSLTMMSVNALVTLLEAFFNSFLPTHRHEGIALSLLCMLAWGDTLLNHL